MKKVAVLQSNYLPWKGYFDIIHDVDLFVFYDDVQYTKNDWRNRNKIKTPQGAAWLTIPIGSDLDRLICEVQIVDERWPKKHLKSLRQYYSKAPYFKTFEPFLEHVYLERTWNNLSELNRYLIESISREFLGIKTTFADSRTLNPSGKKLDRLLDLLLKVEADHYVSGPSAREYVDESRFKEASVELEYKAYDGYPRYPQFHPPFDHHVTVLDLLFHTGPDAPYYIWGWRERLPERVSEGSMRLKEAGA